MKKLVLLIALTVCFSIIYAQDKKVNFGLVAGMNYSTMTNKSKPLVSSRLPLNWTYGFHLGMLVQKKVNANFSTNTVLGISQKGAKSSILKNVGFENTYVNLATHARLDHKRFFAEIGPEIGYLADQRIINDGKRTKPVFPVFDRKIDFLANLGIGAWVTKTTSVSLRVSKGFLGTSEVTSTDESGTDIGQDWKYKNLNLQVAIAQLLF